MVRALRGGKPGTVGRVSTSWIRAATVLVALTTLGFAASPAWPPFLPASEEYPADVANAVRRLWTDATFTRTVTAAPAPVPLRFYLRFVDAPDVTAAAARHLHLTTYDVKVLGDDFYEAGDGNRTRGKYRVLARDGARRVILSWGTHDGSILGSVGGSALAELELAADGEGSAQRLDAHVIIDHGVAAGLSRPFLLLFGWFVDRKLTEAFRTVTAAAVWAHGNRENFCGWLDGAVSAARRAELRDVFTECVEPSAHDDSVDAPSRGFRTRAYRTSAECRCAWCPGRSSRNSRRGTS